MFARLPDEKELAGTGFTPADYEEEAEVWPENWLAFSIFEQMGTQWKTGMAGATGLDYGTLFILLDRHGLSGDDWWQMFDDIRRCESQALKTMQDNKPA
jgi:hypothetical protein